MTARSSTQSGTHLWCVTDLTQALNLPVPSAFPSFSSISIDTRTLNQGDLFVALKGHTFDGHHFLEEAFKKGACGALVSQPSTPTNRCIVVKDTQEALRHMAIFARTRAHNTTFVGLTGSVGKTTVKDGLAHVLKDHGVFATPKSFNNHIGIPLSLATVPPHVPFALFEMGMNHSGEIDALAKLVRPHIGLITAIGPAHIGHFKNQEEIAHAKGELLETLEPPSIAVLPRDSAYFDLLEKKSHSHTITFGRHHTSDIRLLDAHISHEETRFTCNYQGRTLTGLIPHVGFHWAENAMAILGVTSALKIDPEEIIERLKKWPCPQGRGAPVTVQWKNKKLILIDDSYNANPLSMTSALENLSYYKNAKRRIAVLGDMGELGQHTQKAHEDLAEPLQKAPVDIFLAVGPHMTHLAHLLPAHIHRNTASHWQEVIQILDEICKNGDVILLKGSRRMMLDKVVSAFSASRT